MNPQLEARKERLRDKIGQVKEALEVLPHWGRVGGARRVEVGPVHGLPFGRYFRLFTYNKLRLGVVVDANVFLRQ